jgi:hypothetical protein
MTSRIMRSGGMLLSAAALLLIGSWLGRTGGSPPLAAQAAQPAGPAPIVPVAGTTAPAADTNKRVVAYVYGNVPITREEFGDYLISLYGQERLELYVNKRIIELECAKKGIDVTPIEIDATILEDCKKMTIDKKDFINNVLKQRYHKTLEEWRVDVIKPRLLLAKLCRDSIEVTDAELKEMYENLYGEKATVKIILWPKEQREFALKSYGQLREPGPKENPDSNWDAVATKQPSGALAASGGLVDPIGRHSGPETAKIEEIAFGLKVGDVSPIIELPIGCMVVKRVGTVPAVTNVSFEKVKADLRKEVVNRKIDHEVPRMFEGMKKVANPLLLGGKQPLPQPDPSLVKPQ